MTDKTKRDEAAAFSVEVKEDGSLSITAGPDGVDIASGYDSKTLDVATQWLIEKAAGFSKFDSTRELFAKLPIGDGL
jgi:hypothetical protein